MTKAECFDLEFKRIQAIAGRTLGPLRVGIHDIEDVSQDVALKIWVKRHEDHIVAARERGPAGWEAYLTKAVRYSYLDLVRSGGRRELREQDWTDRPPPLPPRPNTVRAVPDDPGGAEEELAAQLIIDKIAQLANQRQRDIALLILVYEHTPREVAELFGLSGRRVREIAKQARKLVRDCLEY